MPTVISGEPDRSQFCTPRFEATETRTYPIDDIVGRIGSQRNVDKREAADWFVGWLRNACSVPNGKAGESLQYQQGRIVASGATSLHELIAELLHIARTSRVDIKVVIEARAVSGPKDVIERLVTGARSQTIVQTGANQSVRRPFNEMILSDQEASELLSDAQNARGVKVVNIPRTIVLNGQAADIELGKNTTCTIGFTSSDDSTMIPKFGTFHNGLSVSVRPFVTLRDRIRLECQWQQSELELRKVSHGRGSNGSVLNFEVFDGLSTIKFPTRCELKADQTLAVSGFKRNTGSASESFFVLVGVKQHTTEVEKPRKATNQ
jgi:hypothetical protein